MTGWKRAVRLGVAVILALGLYFVVPVQASDDGLLARAVISVLSLGLLTAGVVWQILVHVDDPDRKLDGLLFALVVAVLAFALGFYRLELAYPGQIPELETRVDALYFTMTTMLTVGYGDIHAAGQGARVLVMVSMVFNVAVIATAVTTISSRVRQRAEHRAEQRAEERAGQRAEQHAADRQGRRTQRKPR